MGSPQRIEKVFGREAHPDGRLFSGGLTNLRRVSDGSTRDDEFVSQSPTGCFQVPSRADMSNILVINVIGSEARVALVEDGVLAELYVERQRERGIVGNIYKGKVTRVLPGMQAAFVDIGRERAAFLYVTDVLNEHTPFTLDESDDKTSTTAPKPIPVPVPVPDNDHQRIEDQLRKGQQILVQIAKDPIGTKGARLTSHISLPGRHLVFMPTVSHIGISRRITDEEERARLRSLIEEIRPESSGFIVRTAAQDVPSDLLRRDMELLVSLWRDVLEQRDRYDAPALLHEDLDIILKSVRDLVGAQLDRIIVDDTRERDRILAFLDKVMPRANCEVEVYSSQEPIFEAFGIEIEIRRALQRKVWLKSGAYLVIDQTEALTAIDVNTGRFVGTDNLEDTITQINLEAIDEIVYQLRLRNLGGLIIIDFIDMESSANRKHVHEALSLALEADKARTNLCQISDFGLVEMTRKRVSESLAQHLFEPCPYCDGRGHIKSDPTVAYEVLRHVRQRISQDLDHDVEVEVHSRVSRYLRESEADTLDELTRMTSAKLELTDNTSMHREDYRIAVRKPD